MSYKCNLLVPGAPKSGTTAFHDALARHPLICMSRPKEPWFFFGDRFEGGAARHNALFSPETPQVRIYGESSQGYFADEEAQERIRACLGTPKIILLLRHPVERALSQYRYDFRRGIETDPLATALRTRGEDPALVYDDRIAFYRTVGGYQALSRYSRIVPMWQDRFGAENVLLLQAELFRDNPDRALGLCHDFLGLPVLDPAGDTGTPANLRNASSGTVRKVMPGPLRRLAKLMPRGLKSSGLYRGLRQKVLRQITPPMPETPDAETIAFLTDTLAGDIAWHAAIGQG